MPASYTCFSLIQRSEAYTLLEWLTECNQPVKPRLESLLVTQQPMAPNKAAEL